LGVFFNSQQEEKQMQEKTDLLTLEEMAARLRVNQSWLYRQTKRHGPGSIPRLKIGKYLRFNEAAVMAWLRENQRTNQN
jgi:excisionase family DNA binding protein